jgi:hypothetical protein
MRFSPLVLFASCLAFASLRADAQVSVWTYHNNNHRDGANLNETILNLTNVNATTFGKLFSYAVDGYVYAQPLYVPNLNIQGQGTHNVLFIETEHSTVYAFDADSPGATGGLLWQTNLSPTAATPNNDFGNRYGPYNDIRPEIGITGTPVIDLNSGTLYVNVFAHEVSGGATNYFHRLHALNITNGTEQPFSPVLVTASVAGSGVDSTNGLVIFNAKQENERSALTLAGGIVYVAYAGYADTDPYHGWIIGFNATNLVQLTNYVFNVTPNSTMATFGANAGEGGIWAGGGLAVDDETNLYFATANGSFSATNNSGGVDFGDCFMKLSTTNGLAVVDYFTPWNQFDLQAGDKDLGSGGVIILPDQPGAFACELIGAGKGGTVYLLNRDQFTKGNNHFDSTNSIDFVAQTLSGQVGAAFNTPAYFNGLIYYACNVDNLKAFALTNGLLSANPVSTDNARNYPYGSTPSISANGTNNGIVWTLKMDTIPVLAACNATNLTTELYNSSQAPGNRDLFGNGVKFAVPTVADGKVFVGSSNSVSIFGLLAGTFSFSSPTYSAPKANTNVTITVNRIDGTNGAVQVSYATVAGGTAIDGVNYTSVSGALNWTNGESGSKSFTVPIFNDNLAEPNQTVNLALSNPTNDASALGLQSTAVLTIVEPPTSVWKLAHFGTNANNAVAGDSADPDHDNAVNLLEYAFATDPNLANTNSFTGGLMGNQFQIYFPRNIFASDITYILQASGDLTVWSNLMIYTAANGWVTNTGDSTVSESGTNGAPPDQSVNVTITTSTNMMATVTNQFFRLEINR